MLTAIVTWIIVGALAGWIASMITGTDAEQGWAGNIVVGIIGAVIGGLILRLFGYTPTSGFSLGGLLTAILGATILLYVLRGFRRSRI
jgi:uncharacterized membrane protein YeaQ/YmgE (transglycosylase-associated protein family)